MNQGKYVFAQVTVFLPQRIFDRMVDKYQGNKYVRFFTCWNQLSCMLFGQLSVRESLRDLMIGLDAHKSKYYHLQNDQLFIRIVVKQCGHLLIMLFDFKERDNQEIIIFSQMT